MTEMANQIKVGGVYHSQMHSIVMQTTCILFLKYGHFERERDLRIVSVNLSLQTMKLSLVT